MNIQTILSILFMVLVASLAQAQNIQPSDSSPHSVYVIAKINRAGGKVTKKNAQGDQVTVQFQVKKPELLKILEALGPEEEAILEGDIIYETSKKDDRVSMQPIFLIEDIRPISLKKIGKMDDFVPEKQSMTFELSKNRPQSPGFQTTGEVVGAVTLTATVLLLKSLTANKNEVGSKRKIEDTAIFSAGALATGSFLWDQLRLKK
jgi:hypothetical protein